MVGKFNAGGGRQKLFFVRFEEAAGRRREVHALFVAPPSETEGEARGEELAGEGRRAAKAVDNHLEVRRELASQMEQAVEGADTMHDDRSPPLRSEVHLKEEDPFLFGESGAAQPVEATFPNGNDPLVVKPMAQTVKHRRHILFPIRPPRMNAGRIETVGTQRERCRLQQGLARERDYGLARWRVEAVGVDVWEG